MAASNAAFNDLVASVGIDHKPVVLARFVIKEVPDKFDYVIMMDTTRRADCITKFNCLIVL